jgi:hypothetical protein
MKILGIPSKSKLMLCSGTKCFVCFGVGSFDRKGGEFGVTDSTTFIFDIYGHSFHVYTVVEFGQICEPIMVYDAKGPIARVNFSSYEEPGSKARDCSSISLARLKVI